MLYTHPITTMTEITVKITTPAITPITIPIIAPVDRSSSSSLGNTVVLGVGEGDTNEEVGIDVVGEGVVNTRDMGAMISTVKKLIIAEID